MFHIASCALHLFRAACEHPSALKGGSWHKAAHDQSEWSETITKIHDQFSSSNFYHHFLAIFIASITEFAVPSAKSADAYAAHKWEAYSLRGSPPPLDAEGGLLAISKGGGIHVDGIEGAAAAVRAGSPGLLGFAFPSFRRTDVRVSATTECTRLTAMNRGDGEVYLSIPPPADLEEDAGGNHSRAGRGVPVESAVSEWKLRIVAARGVRYTSENVANALNWCGAPHAPLTSLPYGPRWVAQRQSVRKDTTYKVSGSSNDVELKVEAERGTLIIGEHTWKPNWSA